EAEYTMLPGGPINATTMKLERALKEKISGHYSRECMLERTRASGLCLDCISWFADCEDVLANTPDVRIPKNRGLELNLISCGYK
ncbi:hypothetical protein Tco_1576041, partial [Tanacetum coccineum]